MCVREGRPIPDKIQNAPQLRMGLELYYLAYTELMSTRPLGFGGEGPIPWEAQMHWAFDAELDEDQTHDLIYFVTCLDQAYLNAQAERRKRDAGTNGNAGPIRAADTSPRPVGRGK